MLSRSELRHVAGVADMKLPTINLLGKTVIILTGVSASNNDTEQVNVEAPQKLAAAARRNPDAVAFGYVSGQWVAGA